MARPETGAATYPSVTIPGGTAAPTGVPTVIGNCSLFNLRDRHHGPTLTARPATRSSTGTPASTDWMLISGNQTSPYTHTDLTTGTQYYYVVRGVNAGGERPLVQLADR